MDDAPELAGFFFKADVQPVVEDLVIKDLSAAESAELAKKIVTLLEQQPDMKVETVEPPMRELVEQSGLKAGQVFGLMRNAITAQRVSPPLFESMQIIGKDKVVARMRRAVELLSGSVGDRLRELCASPWAVPAHARSCASGCLSTGHRSLSLSKGLHIILNGGKIPPAKMGARLTAGQQTLNLLVEVRILCPQPEKTLFGEFFV